MGPQITCADQKGSLAPKIIHFTVPIDLLIENEDRGPLKIDGWKIKCPFKMVPVLGD